jgi:hypothetical protein
MPGRDNDVSIELRKLSLRMEVERARRTCAPARDNGNKTLDIEQVLRLYRETHDE